MKNKKQAIEALKKGCQLKGENIQKKDGGGGYDTCAIGALALASGLTFACIRKYEKLHNGKGIGGLKEIVKVIWSKFNIDCEELSTLQDINDDHTETKKRRQACVKYLDKLDETP